MEVDWLPELLMLVCELASKLWNKEIIRKGIGHQPRLAITMPHTQTHGHVPGQSWSRDIVVHRSLTSSYTL